jgi:hypothetical protein
MPGLGGEYRACVIAVKRSRFVRQAAVFIGSGASISAQIQRKLLCKLHLPDDCLVFCVAKNQ